MNGHWSPFAPAGNHNDAPAGPPTPPHGTPTPATPPQGQDGGYGQPYPAQPSLPPGVNPDTAAVPVVAPYPQGPPQAPQHPPQSPHPPQAPQHPPAGPQYPPHTGAVPYQPQSAPPASAPHPMAPPTSGPPVFVPQEPMSGPPMQANLPAVYGEPTPPTADDFARRRTASPSKPTASMGARAVLRRGTFGLVSLPPSKWEREVLRSTDAVRRNFGGLRQVTVVNPKGGAGKTVAVLMLAMSFGQRRGGYVLAWDNNETQGTLGMRAQQDFHNRTVRDLLSDLTHFQGPTGRVGDLSQYVRSQGEAMFDVLASDESATAGEMLTSQAFGDIRQIVSRFYKLIVVDTGNNVRAANWQSAMDATDQLVITMSARNDSAETAARMLDHLEQSGRTELVRRAVTVVSMPAHRKDLDLPAVQRHFAARTRSVLLAPYEKLLDSGEPIRYGMLSQATKEAWLKIAAAVAEGL
ncbi:chromosome partitioning protein [Stackebrandtia soli]|uniref:MinD/ParA family ATP-binding protein n=1 Tax=Stackebrandtia soli TaxID=1892856 RepID=UPI0039E93529